MAKEGKYIYCIIGANQERNFGPIGIGGRGDDVLTIGYENLSMVVSNCPVSKMSVSRENMLAHERVIEEVMKEFTVLPVRFCTIAAGTDEIRNLLDRRYKEFRNLLRDMDHKIELGVKALWKDMESIFSEIVEENGDIRELKENIRNEADKRNMQSRMEVGRMVEAALARKKEREAEKIVEAQRRTSADHKLSKTFSNEMFMNASFLVDQGREKEFDNIMEDLGDEYRDRVRFMYAGPFPPYNFVSIVIYPEEWEK
jgi:Gas vesicle synthesis protein GvpL/GvpF